MEGKLFILSGPSGVGKDTVLRKLRSENFPIYFAVTATTRMMRPGEKDGVDYFFLKPDKFKHMVEKDGFLEWINIFNDIYYGTPKKQIMVTLAQGKNVLLRIETEGADKIKQQLPETIRIFLAPSHFKDLEERLR